MPMTPTATGYDLTVKPPPCHRAVTTAETAMANLLTGTYQRPQPEHGAHYVATFEPAALRAEYQARRRAGISR